MEVGRRADQILEAGTEPRREREGEGVRFGKATFQAIVQSWEGLCPPDGELDKGLT